MFGRCLSVIYGMGVAEGLLTGKEGKKKKTTHDAPTVSHQGDDSETSTEGEAERLQNTE